MRKPKEAEERGSRGKQEASARKIRFWSSGQSNNNNNNNALSH